MLTTLRPAEFFYVRSDHDPTKVLDVRHADPKPGARLIVYADKSDASANQLWYEDKTGIVRSKLNGYAIDTSGTIVFLCMVCVGDRTTDLLNEPPRRLYFREFRFITKSI